MGTKKILKGLPGSLAVMMAVAILAIAGCGDDDDLGTVTIGDTTYDICESNSDCSGDEVCEG